jgi:hypothetical protein
MRGLRRLTALLGISPLRGLRRLTALLGISPLRGLIWNFYADLVVWRCARGSIASSAAAPASSR